MNDTKLLQMFRWYWVDASLDKKPCMFTSNPETYVMAIPDGLMYRIDNNGSSSLQFVRCGYTLGNYTITISGLNYDQNFILNVYDSQPE